jgi:hypothetical protein
MRITSIGGRLNHGMIARTTNLTDGSAGVEPHHERRLNRHPFFTVLVRNGSGSLWQSQAHFSLAQAKCLLFLHDQLMPDP